MNQRLIKLLLIWILSLILITFFGWFHDFRMVFTLIGIGLLSYSIIFLPFEWVKLKPNKNYKTEFIKVLFLILLLSAIAIFIWIKYHENMLEKKGKLIFGVIVDKDPHKNSFVIEAEFILDDKKYYSSGDSRYLKVGDTVIIRYNPEFPDNNKILNLEK